jgi:hypothetical protein
LYFQMHAHSRLASCFGMHLHQYQHGRLPFASFGCVLQLLIFSHITLHTQHIVPRISHLALRIMPGIAHIAHRTSHYHRRTSHTTSYSLQHARRIAQCT